MARPFTLSSAILIATLAFGQARGDDTLVINYGYPDQSVWTSRLDASGLPANPLLQLAEAIFERIGVPWKATAYPAGRLYSYLEQGVATFSMLVRAPTLDSCCLISREPVARTDLRAYRRRAAAPTLGPESLRQRHIIVIRGYSYGSIGRFIHDPANAVTIEETASHQAAFQMFQRGRGDYVLDYAGPGEEMINELGIDAVSETLDSLDVHLVLNRQVPQAEALMARLEEAARSLGRNSVLSNGNTPQHIRR